MTRGAACGAGIAVAVGIGVAVAVQARINPGPDQRRARPADSGQRIDHGLLAALLSFLGGLLLVLVPRRLSRCRLTPGASARALSHVSSGARMPPVSAVVLEGKATRAMVRANVAEAAERAGPL